MRFAIPLILILVLPAWAWSAGVSPGASQVVRSQLGAAQEGAGTIIPQETYERMHRKTGDGFSAKGSGSSWGVSQGVRTQLGAAQESETTSNIINNWWWRRRN
jgi:hypothetical protein